VEERTVLEHIGEMRSRLLRILAVFGFFAVIGFFLSRDIIGFVSKALAPREFGVELVVSHPMDFLLAEINIAVLFGLLLSSPYIVYHIYSFAKPAFRKDEKRIFTLSVVSGAFLFVAGLLFGYFVILKFTIWFLAGLAQGAGVMNLWNLNVFITFAFLLTLIMGFVFLMPVFIVAFIRIGVIDTNMLKDNRPYVIVGVFIFAAVISPPDPFSQIIVALPMLALFEASILVSRVSEKRIR